MNNKKERWGPKLHKVKTLKLGKGGKKVFYKRNNKLKQLIEKIKQQKVDRKAGVRVRNIEFEMRTKETVHAYYEVTPALGINGVYKIEEYLMSDIDFHRVQYAGETISNEYERETYLQAYGIQEKRAARVMYATFDYEVIQQLRRNRDDKKYDEARKIFKQLVEPHDLKKRIIESEDEDANFIYERGKNKKPREYGYIGGIIHTLRGDEGIYDFQDKRARRINQIVLNTLFHGENDKKNFEEKKSRVRNRRKSTLKGER